MKKVTSGLTSEYDYHYYSDIEETVEISKVREGYLEQDWLTL